MRITSKTNRYTIFFIIILSLLVPNFCFNPIYKLNINKTIAIDENQVFDFSVALDSSGRLILVYREKEMDEDKIILRETDTNKNWNKTRQTLLKENETFKITGSPSIITVNDSALFVSGYSIGTLSGILLSKRAEINDPWEHSTIISNIAGNLTNPSIKFDSVNNFYWLTWKDDHEGGINQYLVTTNNLISWSNITKITTEQTTRIDSCDFIFDENGSAHLVLAKGENFHEKIFYYQITNNLTIIRNETLTDITYGDRDVTILLDSYNNLNVFWTNYTVDDPGFFLGNVFVYSMLRSITGNWSEPYKVGPYVPPDRSASGESDAYNPAVVEDGQNRLWLAYEILEDYAYHSGIDIRSRVGSNWQPSEFLSLVTNRATDPFLVCDKDNNLHCFWLDRRSGSSEVFYRIKYAIAGWSNEKSLSDIIGTPIKDTLIIVSVVVGALIIISIPTIILRTVVRRRQKKEIQERIKELRK